MRPLPFGYCDLYDLGLSVGMARLEARYLHRANKIIASAHPPTIHKKNCTGNGGVCIAPSKGCIPLFCLDCLEVYARCYTRKAGLPCVDAS
jgi:hypothetical protein